jgi:putative hydrolase of the HAD superfamily
MQSPQLRKRCLLIDAMGTLVRLAPPAPRLRTELAERFGIEVSLEQAEHAIAAEIRHYRAHMGSARDAASIEALRHHCAQILREALPPSERLSDVDADSMTETLLAALQFAVFDDVHDALELVRGRGLRVIVVSNWDASLSEVLGRIGLTDMIDHVVTSAQAGASKPDPAIFEFALNVAGVVSAHALHVGDSLDEDVGGAREAGIEVVWLNRSSAPPPAAHGVRTIATLAGLSDLL